MKQGRKRWLEILLAIALLAGVVIFFSLGGPHYQGRSAGYWFNRPDSRVGHRTEHGWSMMDVEAERAFRAMGKDAVPFLIAQLQKDSALTEYYGKHYASWPAWVRRILPAPRQSDLRQARAAQILALIGLPAVDAIPALIASYNRNWLKEHNQPANTILDWSELLTNRPVWTKIHTPSSSTVVMVRFTPIRVVSSGNQFTSFNLTGSHLQALAAIGGTNRQIVPLLLLSSGDFTVDANLFSQPDGYPALFPAIRDSETLLVNSLSHSDNFVRQGAASLLRVLVNERPEVVPPLIKSLKDTDLTVRWAAMHSLGDASNQLEIIVPALCVTFSDQQMRAETIHVLVGLDNYSPRIVSLLEKSLDHPNSLVRAGMLEALGRMGPMAKAALPRIEQMAYTTNEWDREVAYQASLALWNINREPKALVPYRIKDLQSPDDNVRWNAATFLGAIGPAAKSALPALVQMLKSDKSPRLRAKAAITLGQLGVNAQETIPDLRDATKDEYQNVRQAAAEALEKIAAGDKHQ